MRASRGDSRFFGDFSGASSTTNDYGFELEHDPVWEDAPKHEWMVKSESLALVDSCMTERARQLERQRQRLWQPYPQPEQPPRTQPLLTQPPLKNNTHVVCAVPGCDPFLGLVRFNPPEPGSVPEYDVGRRWDVHGNWSWDRNVPRKHLRPASPAWVTALGHAEMAALNVAAVIRHKELTVGKLSVGADRRAQNFARMQGAGRDMLGWGANARADAEQALEAEVESLSLYEAQQRRIAAVKARLYALFAQGGEPPAVQDPDVAQWHSVDVQQLLARSGRRSRPRPL